MRDCLSWNDPVGWQDVKSKRYLPPYLPTWSVIGFLRPAVNCRGPPQGNDRHESIFTLQILCKTVSKPQLHSVKTQMYVMGNPTTGKKDFTLTSRNKNNNNARANQFISHHSMSSGLKKSISGTHIVSTPSFSFCTFKQPSESQKHTE